MSDCRFGVSPVNYPDPIAVKRNFPPYNRQYTSPNENFEYCYPLNILSSAVSSREKHSWETQLIPGEWAVTSTVLDGDDPMCQNKTGICSKQYPENY